MSQRRIAVIDYGVNNVGSVLNMFRRLEVEAAPARTPAELEGASGIVLPGIGSYDAGVSSLRASGLFDAIRELVVDGRLPILGICLGMQLLARGSEEGAREGFGFVEAFAKRFSFEGRPPLKVPHMGWNETYVLDGELFAGLSAPRFYFVHSFHVVCDRPENVAATCDYGIRFAAAIRTNHVFGTQFHPEKSHRFGMRVLANFAKVTEGSC